MLNLSVRFPNYSFLCFAFPSEIRRKIYTTNAIESMNGSLRKVIKFQQIFHSAAAFKLSSNHESAYFEEVDDADLWLEAWP